MQGKRQGVGEAKPLVPGEEATVAIHGLGSRAEGVGRVRGQVVFVEGALPGDQVRVRVTQAQPRYARAQLEEVTRPSPYRRPLPCPVAHACGGCPLMALEPSVQREQGRRRLEEALRHLGGIPSPPVEEVLTLGDEAQWGYRAKVAMPVAARPGGGLAVGYYARGTHQVVEAEGCLVAHPWALEAVVASRRTLEELSLPAYDEATDQGFVRHLVVRVGVGTGEVLVLVATRYPDWPGWEAFAPRLRERLPRLTTLAQCVHARRDNRILGEGPCQVRWGKPAIRERVAGLVLRLSPTSFFQVNPPVAEAMYERAVEELRLRGGEHVVDAHSGVGALALLALRRGAASARAFEVVPQAVKDARANARANGLALRLSVHQGLAEELYPRLYPPGSAPHGVLLDPPRKGCHPQLLAALRRSPPARLVYVSCHPDTLARDVRILVEGGRFSLERVIPVDLFPQTGHLESIAVLRRDGPGPG
jgi:23S rRNA (uracil1939-C5)-methyltransferase